MLTPVACHKEMLSPSLQRRIVNPERLLQPQGDVLCTGVSCTGVSCTGVLRIRVSCIGVSKRVGVSCMVYRVYVHCVSVCSI